MTLGKVMPALVLAGMLLVQRSDAWNVDPVRNYPGSSNTSSLSIADLDNDGRDDVLLISSALSSGEFAGKLVWYRQQADGELATPVAIIGGAPSDHLAADLNHDGRTDLAIAQSHSMVTLLAQPGGGFVRTDYPIPDIYQWLNADTNVVLYDADADGQRDLVLFARHSYAAIYLLDAQGAVRSSRTQRVPTQGYSDYAVGDVDHDGIDDLVLTSMQEAHAEHLAVLGPDGSGGLATRASWSTGFNGINSVAIGDFDADGLKEIIYTRGGNAPSALVHRLLLDPDLNVAVMHTMDGFQIPQSVVAADLNSDGLDDAAVMHAGWYSIGLYSQWQGELLQAQRMPAMTNSQDPGLMAVGDLNSDGCPDIALANAGDSMILQVFRGRECVISPQATVDYGIELATSFFQTYPGEFPDLYMRRVGATLRTHRGGEMLIREPVVHMRLTAKPPYTVNVAGTHSEWGTCTIEGNASTTVLATCTANASASERHAPNMEFSLYLEGQVPTRVQVEAWASSGGATRGEVFDTDMKNQRATLYADFAAPRAWPPDLDALRRKIKPN